jgi:putative transposase
MVGASARREQARYAMARGFGRRAASALVGSPRSGLDYAAKKPARERPLRERLRRLARQHPRYGYRRAWAMLRREGERVNVKRVERLWRAERLGRPRRKVERPVPMPSHDGAPNVVWACDFVYDRCANGQVLRCLTLDDEGTRECLCMTVEASQPAERVIAALEAVMAARGVPRVLRTDNGPEFVAAAVARWATGRGVERAFNQPGKPWQNGKNESFNGRFRDECLNRELFANRREARVLIEAWRRSYNEERPHSALGYRTPNEARLDYLNKAANLKSNEALPVTP